MSIVGAISDAVNLTTIKKAKKDGAKILELRVDTLKNRNITDLKEKIKKLKSLRLPLILTIRSKREGGRYSIPDKKRLELFDALIRLTDYVDIELSSRNILKEVVGEAKKRKKKVIISHHDFFATPTNKKLEQIIKTSAASGADIIKIAAFAGSTADLKRLASLLTKEGSSRALSIIGMGKIGAPSRIFFPFLGSLLTYGSVTRATAPGQPTVRELAGEIKKYT